MRLTDTPGYCSSCFNQDLEQRHVDFEAAWDGPVIGATENSPGQPIDDLILCEKCLAEAFVLLGPHDRNLKQAA